MVLAILTESYASLMASSSKSPNDAMYVFVKEEPDELEAARAFGDIHEDPVLVSLNHPAEAVRRRLAWRNNNRVRNAQPSASKKWRTRGDKLKARLGGPVWDLKADSIVVLGLETYYHLNHVADLNDLVDAITFVGNFLAFVENPITWKEIWLRLRLLKKRFERFQEFICVPGVNFDEDNGKITVTYEYEKYMNKEPDAHKFFRRCSLPEYKSYKFLFATTNVSPLLEEVTGTWYGNLGVLPPPDEDPFLI